MTTTFCRWNFTSLTCALFLIGIVRKNWLQKWPKNFVDSVVLPHISWQWTSLDWISKSSRDPISTEQKFYFFGWWEIYAKNGQINCPPQIATKKTCRSWGELIASQQPKIDWIQAVDIQYFHLLRFGMTGPPQNIPIKHLSLTSGGTVDGWTRAPPGMYETLKPMG